MVRAAADALLCALLAPACATCREPMATALLGAVCARCWSAVTTASPPLCRTCGDTLSTWRPAANDDRLCARCARLARAISMGRAIGAYEGVLREIIHALKYGGRRSVARRLGALMREAGREVLDGADLAVPVPLHLTRYYVRGFNQAADLARHLSLPVAGALWRVRATSTQIDLPEARRHENVRDAFRVVRRAPIRGTVIVLVDDVSTTGATLDACARVLLGAGAKEVRALTAARAAARLP